MKKIYASLFFVFFAFAGTAQTVDTVLYENFQFDVFPNIPILPTGSDTTWVNYDQDGLPSILNTKKSKRWHWSEFFVNATDSVTGEVNYCAISYSYLLGSLPGNRNWLILPPIAISDSTYSLSWRSSPSQLPRYMDGYQVVLSTAGNQVADFSDTLFVAASNTSFVGNGQNTNFSNFSFTPGYIHANSCQDSTYFVPGQTINYGLLEPHTASLADYAGQTVYMAFLHNSDDDDRLAIDDILVTRQLSSGVTTPQWSDLQLQLSPNPAVNRLLISCTLRKAGHAECAVVNNYGQTVLVNHFDAMAAGRQHVECKVESLPAGVYFIKLSTGEGQQTKAFIKK